MASAVLDLVFPPRCAGCAVGRWPFCASCVEELIPLVGPSCSRCGRPTERDLPRCRDCPPPPIALARAPFLYEGPAKAALRRLKFSGWRTVAAALAQAMAEADESRAEVVTWVPLSRTRRAARGYDQARALARAVAPLLGVRALPLLRRTRDTPPQARRSGAQRRSAMSGAFASRGRVRHARVLLVDDVLTTGATAAECARVLLGAGAREVCVLVAARAIAGPLPARCYTRADSRPSLWLPGEAPR